MTNLSLRSFAKFLSRNKLYTAINVFGLSVSLMFVILIAQFTYRQLTVDNFQANAERIYIVGNEDYLGSAYRLSDRLLSRYPEIEKITAVTHYGKSFMKAGDARLEASMLFVDTTFFDIFSFELVKGDPHEALAARDNIVISETFARKVFADADPMGRTLFFYLEEKPVARVINGVMKDIDNSVIPASDILMRAENLEYYNRSIVSERMNNAGGTLLCVLAREGADLQAKAPDMVEYFKTFYWPYSGGAAKKVILVPLREVYFGNYSGPMMHRGNWQLVMILISAGFAILLFALINYINLTVAQTGFRAKEMSARRLLGATRGEILGRFILESTLICAAAFVIGFLLAAAFEVKASDLLEDKIGVLSSISVGSAAVYAGTVIVLGVISGIIPAVFVSRYKPIDVMRGSFQLNSKLVFSRIFIIFQNIITIVLICASTTMLFQIKHLLNAPLGYDAENIIDVSAWSGFRDYAQVTTFREELRSLACVEDVSFSDGTPVSRGNNNTIARGPDEMISFQVFEADSLFPRIYGLKLKRDNHLAGRGVFLNERAVSELGISEEDSSFKIGPDMDWTYDIAGIYYDFQLGSALENQGAVMLYRYGTFDQDDEPHIPWNISVKIRGDRAAAFEAVREVHHRLTGGEPFEASYLDSQIAEEYASQRRVMWVVMIFTLIAVLISALGLLAMSTYFTRQRSAEIAVRKVFGSTRNEILSRLVTNFMMLVGIAFLLSVPIVWYFMEEWLRGYAIRISLSPLIFVVGGVFAVATALIAVSWQSIRAADENPVDSLRR